MQNTVFTLAVVFLVHAMCIFENFNYVKVDNSCCRVCPVYSDYVSSALSPGKWQTTRHIWFFMSVIVAVMIYVPILCDFTKLHIHYEHVISSYWIFHVIDKCPV
jgi:hypothetical protein